MDLDTNLTKRGRETENETFRNYSSWLMLEINETTSTYLERAHHIGARNLSDCLNCGAGENVNNHSEMMVKASDTVYSNDDDGLYDVPLSIVILLSLLYGGISAAALIGNMLVLWIVTVSRRMRTVTNMFIANLALADIIIGLFTIPFQFQAALLQRWDLPDFMCAFCPFVQVLSVNISVFTLSAIAVDRYRAVLFPLSARVSKRKAGWAILTIWIVGFLLAFPTELDYKVIYVRDHKITSPATSKPFCANVGLSQIFRVYYTIGLVVIQYFFPLIIITGAYLHIYLSLSRSSPPGNSEASRDTYRIANKKKAIKMLALVVLLFSLCWAPYQTYNFLQTLIPKINQYQYINIIWFCSHWLAMSNSCCNPFIYAIYNDKFQREFQTRFWCLRVLCNRARGVNGQGGNFSECSDFIDKSKIRATYRFTNNRPLSRSSMYNPCSSVYGGSATRTTNLDSPRDYCINASRHLSPSPVYLGINGRNNCRSLTVDRPRNFYDGNGSFSSGSSAHDAVGVHDGNDCDFVFYHCGSSGESSANVVVNYERNGMISSSAVPMCSELALADRAKCNSGKMRRIEVEFHD